MLRVGGAFYAFAGYAATRACLTSYELWASQPPEEVAPDARDLLTDVAMMITALKTCGSAPTLSLKVLNAEPRLNGIDECWRGIGLSCRAASVRLRAPSFVCAFLSVGLAARISANKRRFKPLL